MTLEEIEGNLNNIKTIYNEILDDYNKLINEFCFIGANELVDMYTYLYNEGYLSNRKNFIYNTLRDGKAESLIDYSDVHKGVYIIHGYGCCRYISDMLCDILKNNNINSDNCPVFNGKGLYIKRIIFNLLKLSNHMITVAEEDGKAYYFDPTNELKFVRKHGNVLRDCYFNEKIVIRTNSLIDKMCKMLDEQFNYDNCKSIIQLPSANMQKREMLETYCIVREILKDNRDILEKFYNDEKYKYEEISSKIDKLENETTEEQIHILFKKYANKQLENNNIKFRFE